MADGAFSPTATAVSIAVALHMESVVNASSHFLFFSFILVRYFLMYIFVLS